MSVLAAALWTICALDATATTLQPRAAAAFWLSDDLNGDGRADLIGVGGRSVSVFLFEDGGFRDQPTGAFELPADTVFVDLGDADGDLARELCILTPRGALSARIDQPDRLEWKPLLGDADRLPEVFAVEPSDIAWNDILRDVDGIGFEDVVLPVADGYRVFLRAMAATEFRPAGIVPVTPTGSFELGGADDLGALTQTIDWPRIFIGDVTGDPMPELMTFDGTSVRGYTRPAGDEPWPESFSRVLYSGDCIPAGAHLLVAQRAHRSAGWRYEVVAGRRAFPRRRDRLLLQHGRGRARRQAHVAARWLDPAAEADRSGRPIDASICWRRPSRASGHCSW
jgi:hypothetical protein